MTGPRTAVVTGVGVAAPSGLGAGAHWATVVSGKCCVDRISLFDPSPYPTTLAGEVRDFNAAEHVEGRVAVQTDRWTWLGFAAASEALADAGLEAGDADPYAMAVALASSSGGNLFGQKELQRLWSRPGRTVGAYQSIAWFYAASVGQLSISHGMKGPSTVLAAESAGGLDSFGYAVRAIRRSSAAVVLAGGTECPLSPYALACQQRSGWLSTEQDPTRAYRPFEMTAAGYVPGEGGAVFVVEDLEHARARGARIYAEVAGWASTHDGAPTRRGGAGSARHYARAMALALERAGMSSGEIDVVFADAMAVPGYDRSEAEAVRTVFGAEGVAVTTQKPLTGRLYQGGSALDVATALLAMRHGTIPHLAALEQPVPGDELDLVRASRPGEVSAVMVNARGFDGFNSSLVLRRLEGS